MEILIKKIFARNKMLLLPIQSVLSRVSVIRDHSYNLFGWKYILGHL